MMAPESTRFLSHDIRFASRSLGRSPGFVVAAVLSLGLAIGVGIAGFSVVDAVRFRALPFPEADRLVLIGEEPKGGCATTCNVNYLTFALLREHKFRSLDVMAGFFGGRKSLGIGEDQTDITAAIVSGTIFPMLNAKPEIGRLFTADEDRLGAAPVTLIGHDLWMSRFGGDPAVLGKTIILSDEPFTVIGVMPPGFTFESRSDTWLAASRYLDLSTGTSLRAVFVLGRLAPGVTAAQLKAELQLLEPAANASRPEQLKTRFQVSPFRSRYVNATQSHDLVFAAIVGAILLIACANVAGLVLVRALRSRRELAIRTALGASSFRLARPLFVQNMLLAAAGMVIGLGLAGISLNALRSAALLQSLRVPGMEYRLDLRAVLFALVVTVVCATLLSLAPLRLLAHSRPQETLREGALTATTSRRGNRTQQLFVVVQTACAVALLVGTGLMAETALRFSGIELGYDAGRVVQVSVVPAHAGRVKARYLPVADRLLTDFATIPGVELTALRMPVPFGAALPSETPTVMLDGDRTLPPGMQPATAYGVSPDYFKVMGIPLVDGRTFSATDVEGAPPVAIINEWAAQQWWPGANPVGRRFSVDTASGVFATVTVVGVVRNSFAAQESVLLAKPGPEVYRPYLQANFWIAMFYSRTKGAPGRIVPEVQKTVLHLVNTNGRPPTNVMSTLVGDQIESVRTNALQIAGFAVVGLLLAITGLYGVLSYVVQQRTQEIGIRGVLGAGRGQILGLVLGQALRLAAFGVVAGLAAAALATRLIQGVLYGTPGADPVVYIGVAAVFMLVALAASYVPARRAARVDPAIALRAT